MNIDLSQTPEKFHHMKDEILPILVELLKKLTELEEKYAITMNKNSSNSERLWAEYQEKYKEIILPICTEKLISRGYARSLSEPATYAYINAASSKIDFIMKSAKKITIETHFAHGVDKKHQFSIIQTLDGWKIDSLKYGFEGETNWYIYHI